MLGGYQIIDMGGAEIKFDISQGAPFDSGTPIKKQGIYEIFKSVGSKPILIENLNITFVEVQEDDTGEIVVNVVDKISSPFFAEYQKRETKIDISIDIYSSALPQALNSYGVYYEGAYIKASATNKDILLVSI